MLRLRLTQPPLTLHIHPPSLHAPVLLRGSTLSSLSSLLPTFCFLNIPECNNHSRFSSLLAPPDFLSSFPNTSGYLTPWHMDFPAFSVSEHLSILLPNTSLAFDWFRSYFKTPASITFILKQYYKYRKKTVLFVQVILCYMICMMPVYWKLLMKS